MCGRFDYVKYDDDAAANQAEFKRMFVQLEYHVESCIEPGRARSLVLTKLEEAYMWVGKAIRDDQIARGSMVDDVPERSNV
jgi:hypothetical protein